MMAKTGGTRHERALSDGRVLALAMLSVELIAAMQSYVTGTITPLMAADLHAQEHYGLLVAAVQAALFLTMPLGAALLARWSAATMLSWLTPVVVLGGVVSALAPTFPIFLGGRVLAALASGALMTVGMSALVTALPEAWRRGVLAGYAMVWLVASLVGPLYAGSTAAAIGWRWALVAYLPLLLLARTVVISRLRRLDRGAQDRDRALRVRPAIALAGGITLVSLAGPSRLSLVLAAAGAVVVVAAAGRILPPGVLTARRGRPSAILLLAVLCAGYFGAQAVVAITAHDLLGRAAAAIALLLGAGGAGWSVLGAVCSRWPARTGPAYARRIAVGAGCLALGLIVLAGSLVPGTQAGWTLHLLGWTLCGIGMGACYVDTLNRVLDEPTVPDGIDVSAAAQALVMSEAIGTALLTTATATTLAWVVVLPGERTAYSALVYAGLGALTLLLVPLARRT